MAYRRIVADSTSQIIEFPVFDSSSTIGALLAGLLYNTSSLTAYYSRQNAGGAWTAMSLVTMTKGTWTSLGFIASDATNAPGVYQLGIPNAAIAAAAGVTFVTVVLKGAANMVPVVLEIELTSVADYPSNITQIDGVNNGTHASGMIPADVRDILGTAVSTPATAGILDVNVKNMNNVAGTAITTINANVGQTQPVNFTGTGSSALVKSDMVDIAGAAVSTSTAQVGVNVVTQANIDFGALQKTSLNAATPVCTVSGDLSATMKTSVTTACSASTPVATVSGDFSATMKTSLNAATPTVTTETISAGAINNAAFNDDVNTTAYATNKLALMLYKFFDYAFTGYSDGSTFTANGFLDRITKGLWILRNKMAVTDANGNTVVYKDDSTTAAFTVSSCLTDDSTTTTRLRLA